MQRRSFLSGLIGSVILPIESYAASKHIEMSHHDLKILTATLWGEARGEGITGIKAVAHVIFNRVKSEDSIFKHDVSIARTCLRHDQFSCWGDREMRHLDYHGDEFKAIKQIALDAYKEWRKGIDYSGKSTFYLKRTIKRPEWARHMRVVKIIKNHEFLHPVKA